MFSFFSCQTFFCVINYRFAVDKDFASHLIIQVQIRIQIQMWTDEDRSGPVSWPRFSAVMTVFVQQSSLLGCTVVSSRWVILWKTDQFDEFSVQLLRDVGVWKLPDPDD